MKIAFRMVLVVVFTVVTSFLYCQTNSFDLELIKPNLAKEKQFLPYLAVRHGGMPNIEEWKNKNTIQYYKELWYYCESFYIKRNHFSEGATLNESIIDISRFESARKEFDEAIVILPGFKDVLVLLPNYKLVYKPSK